jgi:hypothetical protein
MPFAMRDLDGQSQPGVNFQRHGAPFSIHHDIDADVTENYGNCLRQHLFQCGTLRPRSAVLVPRRTSKGW